MEIPVVNVQLSDGAPAPQPAVMAVQATMKNRSLGGQKLPPPDPLADWSAGATALLDDWQALMGRAIARIDLAVGEQTVVLSGAREYWAYLDGDGNLVLGWHHPGDAPVYDEDGQLIDIPRAAEFWQELIFNPLVEVFTERELASTPDGVSILRP